MGGIVWLASYPKSGNTWVRAFLHNLIAKPRTAADINQMTELTKFDASLDWFKSIDKRPPDQWSVGDVDRMRPQVQEMIARSKEGPVFCKTHSAQVTIRGYPTINPRVSSGAIYIVRNPLDVAVSFAKFSGISIDTTIASMAANNYVLPTTASAITSPLGSWTQHVESWTGPNRRGEHVMRYEDMIHAPRKTFGALTKYLRMKPARAQLDRAIRNSSFKVLRDQEDRSGFGERPENISKFFRSGTTDQWQDVLTDKQVAMIVDAHAVQMERFGYLPTQQRG